MNWNRPTYKERLSDAVRSLCPIVAKQMASATEDHLDERQLRRELVSCALGSQVTYGMASAALVNLESLGLLNDEWWTGRREPRFDALVFSALDASHPSVLGCGRYRFPVARSRQLAGLRDSVARCPLQQRIDSDLSARGMRAQFVKDLPGIGAKQASMFLRNSGVTLELAILDRHILRYLVWEGVLHDDQVSISTLNAYERAEDAAKGHAQSLGYEVGVLDLAIWATMKAAQELGL